jgi:hypothetical protein
MTSSLRLSRATSAMALALVVAVAAAGCASEAHRSATAGASIAALTPATTVVHVFKSAAASGAPSAAGACWTTSIAVPKPGAYRCLAGNTILDPCFALHRTATLATCYADPWSKPVVLKLEQRLPELSGALPDEHPWALLLSNGHRCVAVTGTVQIVGNVALTYSCGKQSAAGLAGGDTPLRQAFYRAGPEADLDQVDVTDVWQG